MEFCLIGRRHHVRFDDAGAVLRSSPLTLKMSTKSDRDFASEALNKLLLFNGQQLVGSSQITLKSDGQYLRVLLLSHISARGFDFNRIFTEFSLLYSLDV
ncbi:hypothetical protein GPALN_004960 [Globodera pallida]|nr:hypothetical protein GPALN_004960 [Globodera pallida]